MVVLRDVLPINVGEINENLLGKVCSNDEDRENIAYRLG